MKAKDMDSVSAVSEIVASNDFADLVTLKDSGITTDARTSAIAGTALRLRVSQRAIEAVSRDKRVKHRFGLLESDGHAIGNIALHIGDELYVSSLDLGAQEIRSAMAEACSARRLPLVLLSETGESQMVLLPASGGLEAFWEAAQIVEVMDVPTFVRTMGEAVNKFIGTLIVELLQEDRRSIAAVRSSYVMSEVLVADLERRLSGYDTIQ